MTRMEKDKKEQDYVDLRVISLSLITYKWISLSPSSISIYRNNDNSLMSMSSSPQIITRLSSTMNFSFWCSMEVTALTTQIHGLPNSQL